MRLRSATTLECLVGLDGELVKEGSLILPDRLGEVLVNTSGGLLGEVELSALLLEPDGAVLLALVLEGLDGVAVLPPKLVAETVEAAVVAEGVEAEAAHGAGAHEGLLLVIRGGAAIEGGKAAHGPCTPLGAVRDHTTDSTDEKVRGSAEVEGTTLGVSHMTLVEPPNVLELVTEERTAHNKTLAPDDNNTLPTEDVLRHGGGETTEDVIVRVDDNGLGRNLTVKLSATGH